MADGEPILDIDLYDGKYTVQQTDTRFAALRYGQDWRDLTGDNLVLFLAYEVEQLRHRLGLDAKTGKPKESAQCQTPTKPSTT